MLFDDSGKKVLDEKKNPWVDFTSWSPQTDILAKYAWFQLL